MSEPVVEPIPAADEVGSRRFQRLAEGVRKLRVGGGTLNLSERTLMIAGGVLAPLGLVIILIGWYGAAHSPFLFQQVPYLISGGLFGIGLVFLGSFFYFAHWVTELVKESRAQSAAVVEAISRLEETIRREAADQRAVQAAVGAARSAAARNGTVELVATLKGSMVHRPDCVVVAGKKGLRRIGDPEGFEPCKLCDPLAVAAPSSN